MTVCRPKELDIANKIERRLPSVVVAARLVVYMVSIYKYHLVTRDSFEHVDQEELLSFRLTDYAYTLSFVRILPLCICDVKLVGRSVRLNQALGLGILASISVRSRSKT